MRYNLVKEVFFDKCKHLKIDQKLLKKLHFLQVGFVNKNEEHISFFGGHLIGVHKVRWTGDEEDFWFMEILEVGDYEVKSDLHRLPGINPEFKVSSDIFNLSVIWLLHAIYNSKDLNEEQKYQGMLDVALILNYRYITSRLAYYFKFAADPDLAEQTYSKLTYKFSIKQFKTWQNVLTNRSKDIIDKEGIHIKTISQMASNDDVVKMINDTQGRIRDMIKNIFSVLMEVQKTGKVLTTNSDVSDFNGESILKDKINGLSTYTQYLKSIVSERNSFIKDDLVNIINRVLPNISLVLFEEFLEWISDHFTDKRNNIIEEVLEEIMVHSYQYLEDNRSILKGSVNLVILVERLKGVYTASRSSDETLLTLRYEIEKLITKATGNKNKNIVPTIRTGFMLYVICRAFTKNHYS